MTPPTTLNGPTGADTAPVDALGAVDFGRPSLRLRVHVVAVRVDVRTMLVCLLLAGAVAVLAVVGLMLGDFPLAAGQVLTALTGRGHGLSRTVVWDWRLPRVLAAIVFGAALAVSGAIFQTMTRNPLASPDMIGFTAGSYTGGLLVILAVGDRYAPVAVGSLAGGLVAAALVYLLAYQHGIAGFRLIVIGIGVAAVLDSVNSYLILHANLADALNATVWGAGSLNTIVWQQVAPATTAITVLLAAAALLARPLRQLELGDDTAGALGVSTRRTQLLLTLTGVGLVAVVTAAAGPIAFVALVAPQIARRATASPSLGLAPSAAMGAVLLLGSDLIAEHLLDGQVPAGMVTLVTGGCYLIWLLVREIRRHA